MLTRKINNTKLGDFNFDIDIEIIRSDKLHKAKSYMFLIEFIFTFNFKKLSECKNYILESYLNNERRKSELLQIKRDINTKFINYMYNNETIQTSRYMAVALASLQVDIYNNTEKPEKKPIKLISNKEIVKKEYYSNLTDLNS